MRKTLAVFLLLLVFQFSFAKKAHAVVTTDWIHASSLFGTPCINTVSNGANAYDGVDSTAATVTVSGQNCIRWVFPDLALPDNATISRVDFKLLTQTSFSGTNCTRYVNIYDPTFTVGHVVSSFGHVDTGGYGETTFAVSSSTNSTNWNDNLVQQDGSDWTIALGLGGGSCVSSSKNYHEAYIKYTYTIEQEGLFENVVNAITALPGAILGGIEDLLIPDSAYVDDLLDDPGEALNDKIPFAYVFAITGADWTSSVDSREDLEISWNFGKDAVGDPINVSSVLPDGLGIPIFQFMQFVLYFSLAFYLIIRARSVL